MKFVSALVGLAALCGVALSGATASAMPVAIPARAPQASNVQQAAFVCNGWGHCWHQPGYGDGDGYFHPHYYGGWGWHRGWGYGWHRWHHWHHGWGLRSALLASLASRLEVLASVVNREKGATAPFFLPGVQ